MAEKKIKVPKRGKEEIGAPAEPQIMTSTVNTMFNLYKLEETRVDSLTIADYRRMRDNDGEVQMLLSATKNTIQAAGFDILDDPEWEDKENPSEEKQFIEKNLLNPFWKGGMSKDINMINSTFLRALEEGFIPHEVVHKLGEDGKIYLDKVVPRTTRGDLSDLKMLVDKHGNFQGVYQRVTIGGDLIEVTIANDSEIHKIINPVWGEEYGSNFGRPALKPIWYHYDKGHKGMYLNHIGHELGAVKFRHVKKKATGNANAGQDSTLIDVLERVGVNGVAIIPDNSYELIFEDVADAQVLEVGKKMIDYHTSQMAKAWLAQFIELGVQGNSGSRALSGDTIAFFKNGLQHIATILLERHWNVLIADLIKLNFNRGYFPRIKWRPLQDDTVETLFTVLTEMVKGNQVTESFKAELLGKVSDKMNLNISEEEIKKELEQLKQEKEENKQFIQNQANQRLQEQQSQQKKPANLSDLIDVEVEKVMRPLYKDEQKVRLADISRKLDDVKDRSIIILRNKLFNQKEKILQSYIQALRSGRNSIKKTEIELQESNENTYFEELFSLMLELMEAGKIFAANELASKIPNTLLSDRNWVRDRVEAIVDEQSSRLKFRLQQIAFNALQRKQAENEVKLLMEQELTSFFDTIVPPTVNAVVPDALNYGRSISFRANRSKIFAYRYTAVLDSNTTEFCRELDGRVFQETDPDFIMLTPPNHFGCRSIWTPITKEEAEDVTVNGKPIEVPTYSSLNTFRDI